MKKVRRIYESIKNADDLESERKRSRGRLEDEFSRPHDILPVSSKYIKTRTLMGFKNKTYIKEDSSDSDISRISSVYNKSPAWCKVIIEGHARIISEF